MKTLNGVTYKMDKYIDKMISISLFITCIMYALVLYKIVSFIIANRL
jgi:hypothetical protein